VFSVWVWVAVVCVVEGVVVFSVWVAVVCVVGGLTVSWLEQAVATTQTVNRMVAVAFNSPIRKEAMQHYPLFDAKKMARSSNLYRKFRM
jgi:hypothetical protein